MKSEILLQYKLEYGILDNGIKLEYGIQMRATGIFTRYISKLEYGI